MQSCLRRGTCPQSSHLSPAGPDREMSCPEGHSWGIRPSTARPAPCQPSQLPQPRQLQVRGKKSYCSHNFTLGHLGKTTGDESLFPDMTDQPVLQIFWQGMVSKCEWSASCRSYAEPRPPKATLPLGLTSLRCLRKGIRKHVGLVQA